MSNAVARVEARDLDRQAAETLRVTGLPAWMNDMIERSLGDCTFTPELDQRLGELALAAASSSAARDDLFTALAFKSARFQLRALGHLRTWHYRAFDVDVLAQEAWFVFLEVLRAWNGRPRRDVAGFVPYYLKSYPLALNGRFADCVIRGELARDCYSLEAMEEDRHSGVLVRDTSRSFEQQLEDRELLRELEQYLSADELLALASEGDRKMGEPRPMHLLGTRREATYRARLAEAARRARMVVAA